jgi:hypothetical protein
MPILKAIVQVLAAARSAGLHMVRISASVNADGSFRRAAAAIASAFSPS